MPKYSFASFVCYTCENVAFVFKKSSYLSKRVELGGVGKRRNHSLLHNRSPLVIPVAYCNKINRHS